MAKMIDKLLILPKYILYRIFVLVLPVNRNIVTFESYWGKGYSCNPKAISDYIKDDSKYKRVWFFSKLPQEIDNSIISVEKFSLKYFYYLAVSGYIISNANHPNFFIKRKSMTFVQTKHGTPLKMMGLDELTTKSSDHSLATALKKRCSNWNYVISSNNFSTNQWKKSFPFDYQVLEIGYPRNDKLFTFTSGMVDSVKAELGINGNDTRKVVLIMPTFREYHDKPEYYIDFKLLSEKLSSEYIFLVRAHYFNDDQSNVPNLPGILDVTLYPHVENLYIISDVLITDYSSSMFDYACLKRDIILYLPDYEEYKVKRGVNFDIVEDAPGLIVYNCEDLVNALDTHSYELSEHKVKGCLFNQKFCKLDDGQASQRLYSMLFQTFND